MHQACAKAKDSMDLLFSTNAMFSKQQKETLNLIIYRHMTVGTTVDKHNISCKSCWDYYDKLKQRYCGG